MDNLYLLRLSLRFKAKTVRVGKCLVWTAYHDRLGYGRISVEGTPRLATHVAWFLKTGIWPTFLCHKCDAPSCVEIKHLFQGDHAANRADMLRKGLRYKLIPTPEGIAKSVEAARLANTGRPLSPEHKLAVSLSLKGRQFTPEWRAKISSAKMGHPVSEETRWKASRTRHNHERAKRIANASKS